MSSAFMEGLQVNQNQTQTENGANALKSSGSALVDLFAQGGALRTRSEGEIVQKMSLALSEDPLLAVKMMFYFRDIRGAGQGERRSFRVWLKYIATLHPSYVEHNISLIPFYGRWDDLWELIGTPLEKEMFDLVAHQLQEDMVSDKPSLLAKWMKSENTSSSESVRVAKITRNALAMSSKAYRKMLTTLRSRLNVLETQISRNKWNEIEYNHVPSRANLLYRKAFLKHDSIRRKNWIEGLSKGTSKINTSGLFPYDIIHNLWTDAKFMSSYGTLPSNSSPENIKLMQAAWNSLPDHLEGFEGNAIVVADVSGSMYGRPIEVAISLAIYFAERNKTPAYHNQFITFSERPSLVQLKGETLLEQISNMVGASWSMNTNLESVFDLILNVAISNNLEQHELPDKLFIVSDMEFDRACYKSNVGNDGYQTLISTIDRKFKAAGYQMPKLVFWNVNSRNDQVPAGKNENGIQLVSGCSPSILKFAVSEKATTAEELMLEVLNDNRYQPIVVD